MYITDLLDGYLARKLDQVTETGKIIDPLADKIAVIGITVILFASGRIPAWFFFIIILRDVVILSGGIYLNRKYNLTLMSNYPGKIAVFSIGLFILLTIINTEAAKFINSFLIYISLLLILYSSYLYFYRFTKTIGGKNGKRELH